MGAVAPAAPAPTLPVTKAQAKGIADGLSLSYYHLYPFKTWPDIKPAADILEAFWTKVWPEWKTQVPAATPRTQGAPDALGVLPLFVLAGALASKTAAWIYAGGAVAAIAAGAVAAALHNSLRRPYDKIDTWQRTTGRRPPVPVKDPDGKPPDPWLVNVLRTTIRAAAVAAVAAYALSKLEKVIPEAPGEEIWYWLAIIAGGVGAWWIWVRAKKKKKRS